MTKRERMDRAYALRYKKAALAYKSLEMIQLELENISEACCDVRHYIDSDDGTLLSALDDDEEQEWEFKMAFADLEAKADNLNNAIREAGQYTDDIYQTFDDCTVALLGNRYNLVGWDSVEEDYFSLTSWDSELATTESGKRLMRMTKADMLSTIGQCFGILLAYNDVDQQYSYLKTTMDLIKGDNTSLLQTIKDINKAYEDTQDDWHGGPAAKEFDRLLKLLPQRCFVE